MRVSEMKQVEPMADALEFSTDKRYILVIQGRNMRPEDVNRLGQHMATRGYKCVILSGVDVRVYDMGDANDKDSTTTGA